MIDPTTPDRPVEPTRVLEVDGRVTEVFPLPVDEPFLHGFLGELFETHWRSIVFGPLIQGAAFEFRCPNPPTAITLLDGYLTVHFGGTHFHLCIGDNRGSPDAPTPEALRRHRRTTRAEMFRGLDRAGAPITWGARLFNGGGEQQLTIFFPNPFLTDDDGVRDTPDWARLDLWEAMARRHLGRDPEAKDRSGKGFRHD